MRKQLAVVVSLAMVLSMLVSFLPGGIALAASDNLVTRRALIIGNADYAVSGLTGPVYDAKHMQALFKQMDFGTAGSPAENGTVKPGDVKMLANRTKSQIRNDIVANLKNKADDDDVSYFYYSGHGSVSDGEAQIVGVDMNMISLTELKGWLDDVPGTKVVILDSCFSGGFIDKAAASAGSKTGSAGKSSVYVLKGHNRQGAVAAARSGGLQKKSKPGAPAGDLFPSALQQKPPAKAEDLSQQFNASAASVFSKTSKYIDSGKYIVLTAATQNEYSYEFGFNTVYGPNFSMYDPDTGKYTGYAERESAVSGEFTGMLIAGAGKVMFNPDFEEIGLLADYNDDNKITAKELYHFLQGAMIGSDVALYPDDADTDAELSPDTVIFSHATTRDHAPLVRLSGYSGIPNAVTTDADHTDIPITLNISGLSEEIKTSLVVYKFSTYTDGIAINGELNTDIVKSLDISNPAAVSWDGKDEKGNAVPDGIYKIVLEYGEGMAQEDDVPYLYPGVAVVLERGISEPHDTVDLAADGGAYTASGDITISKDGDVVNKWFTADATGAMNVYGDATGLAADKSATCTLYDAQGNTVNYTYTLPKTRTFFLPFYVKGGETYRLEFGIEDNPKAGDTGKFSYSLRLNPTVGVDTTVQGAGLDYEAWYVQPETSAEGNYVIQSYGNSDSAGIVVDRNQTEMLGMADDYYDKHFRIFTPLVKDTGYLIIALDYDAGADSDFSFRVNSPNSAAALNVPSKGAIVDSGDGFYKAVEDTKGGTTFFTLQTGQNQEKWSFITLMNWDDPDAEDYDSDPSILLMDEYGNPVAASDDYNGSYYAEMAAVLQPNHKYILSCRGYLMTPYNYALLAFKQQLTPSAYTVTMPKAVFMDNSAIALDRYGNVSAWGDNSYGEAGVGTMNTVTTPTQVMLEQAVDIWGGDAVGFARLQDDMYLWWGLSEPYPEDEEAMYTSAPQVLDCLEGKDVADIAYGFGQYALVRTYTGELYELDMFADTLTPVSVGSGSHSVVQIATTDYSYFALCSDGKLYSWGENWTGECGTGDIGAVKTPTLVPFGAGVQIKQIAAGWDHVLALSSDGSVYAWGENLQGQLGQGDSKEPYADTPLLIKASNFSGKPVVGISAGTNHSMCVDADGNVYGWGDNAYGELGLGDAARKPAPERIPFYSNLGAAKELKSFDAGMMATFAQDYSHNVYGYGGNLDCQLGYSGQSPEGGVPKNLMTMLGEPAEDSSNLAALHVSGGSVDYSGTTITVSIPVGNEKTGASVVIQPETVDYEATYTIDGAAVANKTVSVAKPGGATKATVVVSHPGGAPASKTYTVNVQRAKSTNTSLSGITLSTGARLSPAVSSSVTNYVVVMPETMSKVLVTPVPASAYATCTVDRVSGKNTYSVGLNGTVYATVVVKSQAGTAKTYYLTIKRPTLLSSLSAAPLYSGYPSLSPGGANTMKIRFGLNFVSDVKIEVKKGSAWYALATLRASQVALGYNTWSWNGKLGSSYLAAGAYTIRVTPILGGKACTAKTLTVKILGKPALSVPTLSPSTFTANGRNKLTFSVRWSVMSSVKVEIVNSKGTVVYTAWSAADQAPATKTLYWYGRSATNALVPAGTYRVKVTAGAAVYYKSFTVKR